jgi:hypothetical protein
MEKNKFQEYKIGTCTTVDRNVASLKTRAVKD